MANSNKHNVKVYFNPSKNLDINERRALSKLEDKKLSFDLANDKIKDIQNKLNKTGFCGSGKEDLRQELIREEYNKKASSFSLEEKQTFSNLKSRENSKKEFTVKSVKQISDDLIKRKLSDQHWYNGNENQLISKSDDNCIKSIYINGHGFVGQHYLKTAEKGEKLSFVEVADRLIESGLSKGYSGDIKLFMCHGIESGNSMFAFTDLFTMYMRKKDFTKCKIHGYDGLITGAPIQDMSKNQLSKKYDTQYHKYSSKDGMINNCKRASEVREEISLDQLEIRFIKNTLNSIQNDLQTENNKRHKLVGRKSNALKNFERSLDQCKKSDHIKSNPFSKEAQKEFDDLLMTLKDLKKNNPKTNSVVKNVFKAKTEFEKRISNNLVKKMDILMGYVKRSDNTPLEKITKLTNMLNMPSSTRESMQNETKE